MEVLFYIAIVSVILGGIVGWFSRGQLYVTIPICALLSFLISVALAVSSALSEGLTWQNWLGEMFYDGIPSLVFIFAPCIVAGVIMAALSYYAKSRTKNGNV
jgi:hypothetical protein